MSFIERCRNIGFVKYLFTIITSVIVTLVIVQSFVIERDVRGCERRQPIFEQLAMTIEDAARHAGSNVEKAVFEARAKKVRAHIVKNCDEAYPPIIPFVE